MTGPRRLLEQLPEPLRRGLRRELQRDLARLSRPVPAEPALLAEIRAEPGDDRPRLVYADLLMERGDPRGELIALQCRENPTLAERLRIDRILSRHRDTLTGPLLPALVPASIGFERGFLASAAVRPRWDLAPLADSPEWCTLRHLDVSEAHNALTLLRSPVCRHLSSARCALGAPLLQQGPEHLTALELLRGPEPDERATYAAAPGLPSLRSLSAPMAAPPRELGWLLAGALGKRLERLGLGPSRERRFSGLLSQWSDLLEHHGTLGQVSIDHPGSAARFALARSEGGIDLDIACRLPTAGLMPALLDVLRTLPPGRFARIDLSGPAALARVPLRDQIRVTAALTRLEPTTAALPWT